MPQGSPKPLPMANGYLICPNCRRNKKLQRITGEEVMKNAELYCRDCKHTIHVDVADGKCYLSSDTKI